MSDDNLKLPEPLKAFEVEYRAGGHKDFGLAPDDPYPLKGVTYPVDYGYLPGYLGEDGADLDFFVGTRADGLAGFILVRRPELADAEHKFFIQLSEDDLDKVIAEFSPVVVEKKVFGSIDELLEQIEAFRK